MKDEDSTLILERGRIRAAASRSWAGTGLPVRALANALELALVAGMWLLLPLWPFAVAAVNGDRGCVRRYGATLRRMVRHIRAQHRSRSIARMLAHRLAREDRADAERPSGACTHCGRCCLERECIFLAYDGEGRSSCRIYGGRLWRLSTCGEYPSNGQDIALYRCPSFHVVRWRAR
jgi:hypothetical protein